MPVTGHSTHSKVTDAIGEQPIDPTVRSALLAIATSFDEMLVAVTRQLDESARALASSQRALYTILVGVVAAMIVGLFSSLYA